jgi:hypothetical protein
MSDLVLQDSCLVLNRNFAIINIVKARRAMSLLAKGKVEVVYIEDGYYKTYNLDSWFAISEMKIAEGIRDDESIVQGIEKKIVAPRIIRTLVYDKVPIRGAVLSRRNIYLRDSQTCQYCGRRLPTSELNLDHLLPKSQGGITSWTNVVCSCIECNSKKGNRTPAQAGMKLIRKPFMPHYNLMLYEKSKEPKYKSWKEFISSGYWNAELQP